MVSISYLTMSVNYNIDTLHVTPLSQLDVVLYVGDEIYLFT